MSTNEDDKSSSFTLELQKLREQMTRFKEITDQTLREGKDDFIGYDWFVGKCVALALVDQRDDMYMPSDFNHRKQVASNEDKK